MSTKIQLMEDYFSKYGKASSVYEMAGILRKRFPIKKDTFLQECRDFVAEKMVSHRQVERVVYIPDVRYVHNPKFMDGNIHNFIRWMKADGEMSSIQNGFEKAFKGLKYNI